MSQQTVQNASLATVTAILFVAVVFVALIAKKSYYFFWRKKRFFVFPRLNIRGITNVSMVIAITVSVVLLLIVVTGGVAGFFFRAYPGSRVTFEIVLVKLSGLLFGPVLGMVSGALIDLFTFSFSAGVFHYGYFISVSLMGLLAGVFRSIATISNEKVWGMTLLGTIYMIGVTAITWLMFYLFSGLKGIGVNVRLTGLVSFHFSFTWFIAGIFAFSILTISVVWSILLIVAVRSRIKAHRELKKRIFPNWTKWLIVSIFASTSTILIVFITLLPVFDSMLDKQPYEWWLGMRIILAIPLVFVDVSIIFPILTLVNSFARSNNYDAKENFADIGEPLFFNDWDSGVDFMDAKMNSKYFVELLNCTSVVKFELNSRQVRALKREFNSILRCFRYVDELDTKNVAAMDFPVETCSLYNEDCLREDCLLATNEPRPQEILREVQSKKFYDGSLYVLISYAKKEK